MTTPVLPKNPTPRSEIWITALCCLAMICEGFDLQAPGVTLASMRVAFNLDPQTQGFFLTIGTLGMMIGAVVGGRLADYIGRKAVLIGSILLYGGLTFATTLAESVPQLLSIRFATGVGLGAALPTIFAVAVEGVATQRRELTVGLLLAGPPIGGALASLLSTVGSEADQWKLVYLVGGLVPAFLVAPALARFLPNTFVRTLVSSRAGSPGIATVLFGDGRAALTVAIWIAFFTMLLVLFTFIGWLPSLLVDRGLSRADAAIVQMLFNLGAIPGTILAGYGFGRRGTRTLTLAGFFLLSIVALLMLGGGPSNLFFVVAAGLLAGMTIAGAQAIIYAMAPSIYPTSGRGTGMGFCVAIGRIGSATGPLLVGWMVAAHYAPGTVIFTLVPIFAVAGVLALFVSRASLKRAAATG